MATEIIIGVILLGLTVMYLTFNSLHGRKYRQIPAIPNRLPIIKNAHNIDLGRLHIFLADMAKTLGPIFRFKLYKQEIVVLNDYETIAEALVTNGHHVAGRPPMNRTSKADRSSHSIVWQTYTPKLVFLRKEEVQRCLKMYGSGLERLEGRCSPEILHMIETISDTKGQAFDPSTCLFDGILCVMLSLISVLGTSVAPNKACLEKLRNINTMFKLLFGFGNVQRMDFLPWLKFFSSQESQDLQEALKMRDDFWKLELLNMVRTEEGVVTQMLTLTEIIEKKEEFDLSESTAKEVFTNPILAGSDTTVAALTCLLLFLLHYPDVQETLYQELVLMVGTTRLPSLTDKRDMPYTEATLLELLRILAHNPLVIPHYTVCDTTVIGKHIPADTTVYINLWAMLHDEKFWKSPWEFRPERFLDNNNQLLPPSHPVRRRMLAFGAGRRVCLGETLAKNRLFLFATALIQNFKFEPVVGEPLPAADLRTYKMGLTLHPGTFKLCADPRQHAYTFIPVYTLNLYIYK